MTIPKPLGVRVLVQTLDEPSGIIIPDGALRTQRGVVMAKGEDVRYLEPADVILFARDADAVYEFRDELGDRYYVMAEGCVLVVLERHPTHV